MDKPHSLKTAIQIYEDESEQLTLDDHGGDQYLHESAEQEYDDQEEGRSESDEASNDDPDVDPFTSSEPDDDDNDDQNEATEDARGLFHSVEQAYTPSISHTHDYSFSRTMPVHIDDRVDPQLGYIQENDENLGNVSLYRGGNEGRLAPDQLEEPLDSRKVSESVLSLPDELDYYRSSLPGRSPLSVSRSHHGSRHGSVVHERTSPMYAPSPRQHQHSLSTPSRVPLPASPQGHSRSNSTLRRDYRPVFRNPSSVRAMQLTSPSPPPFGTSPLSGRRLRRAATPHTEAFESSIRSSIRQDDDRRGTPTRRANVRKEHPLVLLHCTLSMLDMPAGFSALALDAAAASEKTKRDVMLLHQKLDSTVLERGLLIQHPGDDYDLLEERILESLELRRARVGGCGHFRSPSADSVGWPVKETEHGVRKTDNNDYDNDDKPGCDDCSRHVSPALLSSEEHDRFRRWDVRIYAANGLMRAGAWSAAWREMEKVDVEVGVWINDGLKSRLEEWAAMHEDEHDGTNETMRNARGRQPSGSEHIQQSLPMPLPLGRSAGVASPASRATTSRDGSVSSRTAKYAADGHETFTKHAAAHPATPRQVPLATLLYNHVARQVGRNSELLLAGAVVLLGLFLAVRNWKPEPEATAQALALEHGNASGGVGNPLEAWATAGGVSTAAATTIATATTTMTQTQIQTETQSFDVESILAQLSLSACKTPWLNGPDPEWTAFPRTAAQRVLGQIAQDAAVLEDGVDADNTAATAAESEEEVQDGEESTSGAPLRAPPGPPPSTKSASPTGPGSDMTEPLADRRDRDESVAADSQGQEQHGGSRRIVSAQGAEISAAAAEGAGVEGE